MIPHTTEITMKNYQPHFTFVFGADRPTKIYLQFFYHFVGVIIMYTHVKLQLFSTNIFELNYKPIDQTLSQTVIPTNKQSKDNKQSVETGLGLLVVGSEPRKRGR